LRHLGARATTEEGYPIGLEAPEDDSWTFAHETMQEDARFFVCDCLRLAN